MYSTLSFYMFFTNFFKFFVFSTGEIGKLVYFTLVLKMVDNVFSTGVYREGKYLARILHYTRTPNNAFYTDAKNVL